MNALSISREPLQSASSLYVNRTGLSGYGTDKACAKKDAELITVQR